MSVDELPNRSSSVQPSGDPLELSVLKVAMGVPFSSIKWHSETVEASVIDRVESRRSGFWSEGKSSLLKSEGGIRMAEWFWRDNIDESKKKKKKWKRNWTRGELKGHERGLRAQSDSLEAGKDPTWLRFSDGRQTTGESGWILI